MARAGVVLFSVLERRKVVLTKSPGDTCFLCGVHPTLPYHTDSRLVFLFCRIRKSRGKADRPVDNMAAAGPSFLLFKSLVFLACFCTGEYSNL